PAGYYTSRISVKADVKLPAGWQFGTALDVVSRSADHVEFAPTSLDTLVDSPLFAGRHYKRVDLDPAADVPVYVNIVADNPSKLEIKPEQLAAYRKLMKEAYALYGTRSFDRYDFLLALTENFSGIGLEHHRSSENVHRPGHFTEWDKNPPGPPSATLSELAAHRGLLQRGRPAVAGRGHQAARAYWKPALA